MCLIERASPTAGLLTFQNPDLNKKQMIVQKNTPAKLLAIVVLIFASITGCERNSTTKTITMTNDRIETGYAPVNGIKMYYEIHGSGGTPLVLIHGGGSTIETTFGNILPFLLTQGKVIALELQAHGRTSDRDSEESFEQDADDVAALIKFLKIEKADFFGFSNGGNTSMQIALRHPELVNKLIIASAFYKRAGMLPGLFEGMDKASLENMPAPLKEGFLKLTPDKNKLQVMHDKDKNRMIRFNDWTEDNLRSIRFPTLILNGDHDVVTNAHALEMSELIPHARLMILPGEHGSYIGEICSMKKGSRLPELTAAAIDEFRKEH